MFGILRRRSSLRRRRPIRTRRPVPRRKRFSSLRKVMRPSKSRRGFGRGGGSSSVAYLSLPPTSSPVVVLQPVEFIQPSSATRPSTSAASSSKTPTRSYAAPENPEKIRAIKQWYGSVLLRKTLPTTTTDVDEVRRSVIFARIAKKILKQVVDAIHPNLFNCLKYDQHWSPLEYLENTMKSIGNTSRDYGVSALRLRAYRLCLLPPGSDYSAKYQIDYNPDSLSEEKKREYERIVRNIELLVRSVQAAIRESDDRTLHMGPQAFCEYIKTKIGDINDAVGGSGPFFKVGNVGCKEENLSFGDIPSTKFTSDENNGVFATYVTDADRCERRPYAWLFGNSTFMSPALARMYLVMSKYIVGPHYIQFVKYKGRTYVLLGECHESLGKITPEPRFADYTQKMTVTNMLRCVFTLLPDKPIDFLVEQNPFVDEHKGHTLGSMFNYFDILNDSRTRYKTRVLPNVRHHMWDIRRFDENLSSKTDPTEYQGPYGRSKQPARYASSIEDVAYNESQNVPSTQEGREAYIKRFLETNVEYVMRDLPEEERQNILEYTKADSVWRTRLLSNVALIDDRIGWQVELTDIYAIVRMIRKFPGNENGLVVVYGGSHHTDDYLKFFKFLHDKHPEDVEIIDYTPGHKPACKTHTNVTQLTPNFYSQFGLDTNQLAVPYLTYTQTSLFDYQNKIWQPADEQQLIEITLEDAYVKGIDVSIRREILIQWMCYHFVDRSRFKKGPTLQSTKEHLLSKFTRDELEQIFPTEQVHPTYTTTWRSVLEKLLNANEETQEERFARYRTEPPKKDPDETLWKGKNPDDELMFRVKHVPLLRDKQDGHIVVVTKRQWYERFRNPGAQNEPSLDPYGEWVYVDVRDLYNTYKYYFLVHLNELRGGEKLPSSFGRSRRRK